MSLITRLWLIAALIGLICGLLEGTEYLVFSSLKGQIPRELRWLGVSPQILWIAPLCDVFLFVLVVSPLNLFARWISTRRLENLAVVLLSWLSFYDLFSLTGQLHFVSVTLLSTGLALVIHRSLKERKLNSVVIRRSFICTAALVLLLAAITTVGVDLSEKVRIDRLPKAKPGAPNVLLIVLDTLRADHLSSYGYPRPTSPNLDRFAQQGVLFEKAIANSSWTTPSHASFMTGKYPSTHRADFDRPLDDTWPTLSEELSRNGYVTAGFVANTLWASRRSGFARGFIHYEDYFGSVSDMVSRSGYGRKIVRQVLPRFGYSDLLGRKSAADINDRFLHWLGDNHDRPFFCFLNYMDVHDPYLAPTPYQTKFSNKIDHGTLVDSLRNETSVSKTHSPEERKMLEDSYDSCIAYLDSELGNLFRALDKAGLSDNTLIIVIADHGESFGEHKLYTHGHSLYFEQIHVPLIIRYPGVGQAGLRVADFVSLHDIPATIMDLLKLNGPTFSGNSMAGFLMPEQGERKSSSPVLSELSRNKNVAQSWPNHKGWLKSLITSDWHFIVHETGEVELYHFQDDKDESKDVSKVANNEPVIKELKKQLDEIVSH